MSHVPPAPPRHRTHADHGQVLPLVAVLIVLTGVVGLGLGRLGGAAAARAQARTAADAAALAGAVAGEQAARLAAEANRGRLVGYREEEAGAVWAEVEVGPAQATARAEPRSRLRPPLTAKQLGFRP